MVLFAKQKLLRKRNCIEIFTSKELWWYRRGNELLAQSELILKNKLRSYFYFLIKAYQHQRLLTLEVSFSAFPASGKCSLVINNLVYDKKKSCMKHRKKKFKNRPLDLHLGYPYNLTIEII